MQRTPMTRTGFERLRDELDRLKRIERPTIIKAIAEARSHGDLSENAEYHAAREKQSFIEGRINDLEGKVNGAEVIDPPSGGDRVTFASTVRLEDESRKEIRYWIVGSDEADPQKGRIGELETKVGAAEVIDPPTHGERITFGSTVLLEDETGKEHRYWIVGSDEASPAQGKISILSPLARTLIGKSVGASVTAQLPGGKKTFDVLKANFAWTD